MKKGLICLPLVATMLGGCSILGIELPGGELLSKLDFLHILPGNNNSTGGSGNNNTTGGGGNNTTDGGGSSTTGGETVNVEGLNIDFVSNFETYKQCFPYVTADTGTYEATLDGVGFEGLQCFVGSYNNSGYLMMKNKDMGGQCAYLSSRTPFAKSITKVEIVTGSSASTKSGYSIIIDNKPITSASGAVTKTGIGANQTISATASASDGYKYFAVYSTDASVNSQLGKLVVTVA